MAIDSSYLLSSRVRRLVNFVLISMCRNVFDGSSDQMGIVNHLCLTSEFHVSLLIVFYSYFDHLDLMLISKDLDLTSGFDSRKVQFHLLLLEYL